MTFWLTLDGGGLSELKSNGALQKEDMQILPHKNFLIPNVYKLAQMKRQKTNHLKKKMYSQYLHQRKG